MSSPLPALSRKGRGRALRRVLASCSLARLPFPTASSDPNLGVQDIAFRRRDGERMSDSELARDELRNLHAAALEIWRLYLTWFGWFFNLNLIALGWILVNETARGRPIIGLSVLMIFSLLIGIGSGLKMRVYFTRACCRAESLKARIGEGGPDIGLLFGSPLATYVLIANPAALASAIAAWMYVGFVFGGL